MESANPDLKHPQAAFAEPLPYGYLYVGMTVDPPVSSTVFSRPDGSECCTGSDYRRDVQPHRARVSTYLVIGGRVWWARSSVGGAT
jgi:hypothetical protein